MAARPGLPPGPVIDSLFGDLWPEAGLGPQVRLLLGSLGVGVLAALVLPFHQLGLGLLLVLLAGGVLIWRSSVNRRTRWSLLTTVICLGLASLVVLRAAEWLTVLAVLTGIALTAVALADATGLLSQLGALVAWPLAARARDAAARTHDDRDEPAVDPLADRAHRRHLDRRARRLRGPLRLG